MDEKLRQQAIELYDRFTHGGMERRDFFAAMTRIAGGAAAANLLIGSIAASPAAAATVAPDDERLLAIQIEWPVAGARKMKGYQASLRPMTERPLVLVIHENRGLNNHIRDVTRRLALAGYTAIAPDFLTSAGGTPVNEDQAREMIGKLDLGTAVADAVATLDWFRNPFSRRKRRIGAVGFCWGGAFVNRLAVAAGDKLSAGVVYYGTAPDQAEATRVSAPLLIQLAELDTRVNNSAFPWVRALRADGKPVTFQLYDGVNHAFNNDTSAERYDKTAADLAWKRTMAFLRRHLA